MKKEELNSIKRVGTGLTGTMALALLCVCLSPLAGMAADSVWNLNAAGNWSASNNWVSSVIPGSTTVSNSIDKATFGNVVLSAARTVTVDANRNIKFIAFDDVNSDTNGYTLSGGSLVLTPGGAITITGSGGAHTETISSPITIVGNNATYAISNNNSLVTRKLTISGAVTGQSTAGGTTTLTLGGNNPGTNDFSSTLSAGSGGGAIAVVKEGSGTWRILSSGGLERTDESNSFTINGGTLLVPTENQTRNALGSAPKITLANTAGAQLDFGAANHNRIIGFGNLSGGGTNGGNIVNAGYANWGLYIGFDNTSTTFGGRLIAGVAGGAFSKVGTGTLTFTGSGNDAGSTWNIYGGAIGLDFSQAAIGADILTNARALTLQGGQLLLTGKAGAANTQTVNGVTLNSGNNSLALTDNGAASLLLSLGAITRNAGSALGVALPAGTQSAANGVRTTTTTAMNGVLATANSSGIAYATVGGTDWAALSSGNIVALSSYASGVGNYTSANNVDVANGDTPASGITVNTLRFNGNHTLNLSGVNTIGAGGVLVTPNATTGAAISGGTLRAGGGKELVLINNGAQLTVDSVIADSGSGASAFTLSGTGGFRLNGNNTYTGATYIHSGTVTLGSSTALGAAGSSAVWIGDNPNAVLDLNGYDISIGSLAGAGGSIGVANAFGTPGGRVLMGANSLTAGANNTTTTYGGRISGSGTFTKAGTGNLTISAAGALAGFSGNIVVEGGTLTVGTVADTQAGTEQLGTATIYLGKIGGGTADARLDLTGSTSRPIVLVAGNSGTMTIEQTPNSRAASNTRCAGTITGTGELVILREPQSASFNVSGLINHTGNLTLRKNINSASGFSISGGIGGNVMNVTLDQQETGNANDSGISISGTIAATGTISNISSGNTVGTRPTISGVITSAARLVQNSASMALVLSGANTFTGDTFLQAGTLVLGNNLALQNSPLDTSGAGVMDATSRTTPTFGGLMGSKDLTNVITTGYSGITNLTLNPQSGKSYSYSGAIPNGTANMMLTKSGPGTHELSGNNTYSGATTVSNGALRLASANALPGGIGLSGGSNVVKFAGGVLELTAASGDFTRSLGAGTTNAQFTGGGGFSAYGAARFVNLGGATALVTWNTNNFVPTGSSLIFGSSTADARIEFQNPINLNAATRTIQVDDNPATANDYALLSGVVTNGALVKTGAGMLVLGASTNRLSGLTVSNGTLVVSGVTTSSVLTVVSNATALINVSCAAPVTVQQGGTIGGSGTLAGLTLNSGATLQATILDGEGNCQALDVTGSLNVSNVTLHLVNTNLLAIGQIYKIVTCTSHTNTFLSSNLPGDWLLDYRAPGWISVRASVYPGTLLKIH